MKVACNLEFSSLQFQVQSLNIVDGKLQIALTAELTPEQIAASFVPLSTPAADFAVANDALPSSIAVAESILRPTSDAAVIPEAANTGETVVLPVRSEAEENSPAKENHDNEDAAARRENASNLSIYRKASCEENQSPEIQPATDKTADSIETSTSNDTTMLSTIEDSETPVEKDEAADEYREPENLAKDNGDVIGDLAAGENLSGRRAEVVLPESSSEISSASRYGEPEFSDEWSTALENAHSIEVPESADLVVPESSPSQEMPISETAGSEENDERTEPETPSPEKEESSSAPGLMIKSTGESATESGAALSYEINADENSQSNLASADKTSSEKLTVGDGISGAAASAVNSAVVSREREAESRENFSGRIIDSLDQLSCDNSVSPASAPVKINSPFTPPPSVLSDLKNSALPQPEIAPKPSEVSGARALRVRYTCPRCQTAGVQDADKIKNIITCKNCGRAMRLTIKQ